MSLEEFIQQYGEKELIKQKQKENEDMGSIGTGLSAKGPRRAGTVINQSPGEGDDAESLHSIDLSLDDTSTPGSRIRRRGTKVSPKQSAGKFEFQDSPRRARKTEVRPTKKGAKP